MGEREELVEGSEFGKGVAHLSLFLHRRFLLGRCALSLGVGGGGFLGGRQGALILRSRRIFSSVGLQTFLARRRRAKARRAGHDVQEPSNVHHCALFIVVLCNNIDRVRSVTEQGPFGKELVKPSKRRRLGL